MGTINQTAIRHGAFRTQEQTTINQFNDSLRKLTGPYDPIRVHGEGSGNVINRDLRRLIRELENDFAVISYDQALAPQHYNVLQAAKHLLSADTTLDVGVSRSTNQTLNSARQSLENVQRNLRNIE